MPLFGNPLGLLALLGIPAVLAIHFLQRRSRELPASTLFLLERGQREAASGRVFERLVPSIPLWLQILAVLLLAWLLAEPRYRKDGSVQRVAVVLDSSASMSVFKEEALRRLNEVLPELRGNAGEVQLTVLESLPNRPRIYSGSSVDEMIAAIGSWQPRSGPVDPNQALRLARSLASREGAVVYLTDTNTGPLPYDARLLATGEAVENVGFTGVTFTTIDGVLVWKALVKNHGSHPASRSWRIETSGGFGEERTMQIDPGALLTLQAAFPQGAEAVRVVLSADRFPLDDVLPLVAPMPKTLRLYFAVEPPFPGLQESLMRSLDAAELAPDPASADLTIIGYDPASPPSFAGNAVIFADERQRETGPQQAGAVVAEPHPLMDGLNWQSLLTRGRHANEPAPEDTVLLWRDQQPLIFLRSLPGARQLWFNFDPSLSNAGRQPAFVVLLHRFAESIRAAKIAPVSANLETGEPLDIASQPGIPLTVTLSDPAGKTLDPESGPDARFAMRSPGFMRIRQDDKLLLDAAVRFGDPREADFSDCASSDLEAAADGPLASATDRHTRPDPIWRLWVLLLIAALMVSWKFTAKAQTA